MQYGTRSGAVILKWYRMTKYIMTFVLDWKQHHIKLRSFV